MAPKTAVRAVKPRAAKRAARRATRRAAKKARRAAKPKAPKAAKATKPRAPKSKSKAKAVRARKPKRVTKKSQTGSKLRVWNGSCKWTKGGLTRADLQKNKHGRIVSKKASRHNKKSGGGWMKAVMKARKELGITGFCLMNRGTQGVALYKRAKEIYN